MIRRLKQARLWLRSLFLGARTDRELDDELQYHLDRQTELMVSAGLPRDEARIAALREMGAIAQSKEACRDARGTNLIVNGKRNIRFGLRKLARSPGFTTVALATLALGIGANSALFSLVDAVLLRPMPYRDPARLAVVFARNTSQPVNNVLRGAAGATETGLSIADLSDFREQSKLFSDFAAATGFDANMTGSGEPERIEGESVTPNFFSLLGVSPVLGSDFSPTDDSLKGGHSVLLSHEFWDRHWRADPNALGQTISLDLAPYRVVGVLPAGFRTPYGKTPEMFRPVIPSADRARRGRRFWSVVGRMRTGDVSGAQAELATIAGRLASQYPATNKDIAVAVVGLGELIPPNVRSGLIALMFSVGLVLLIACSNIANLLLIRTAGREREIATRQALGASASELFQQFLTENLLVAIMGGVLGLAAADWLIHLISGASAGIPRADESRLDWRVLAFTFAITMLSGLFFTLLPIGRAIGKEAGRSLVSRSGGSDKGNQRLSNALVVTQTALAVVLLIESGLMLRSFVNLQAVEPGFHEDRIVSFRVSMSRAQFRGTEQSAALFAALTERIRSVPGVESAGATLQLPIDGLDVDLTQIAIPERPVALDQEPSVRLHVVTPQYFSTLGVPLLRGRFFSDDDRSNSKGVAIVNEAMARRIWGTEDPVGKQITQRLMFTPGEKPDRVIVGVVPNMKHFGLEFEDEAQMYVPHRQSAWPAMYFVVRTGLPLSAVEKSLKQAVWAEDGKLPLEKLATMQTVLSRSMDQPRVRTAVVSAFGATAILLAAIGIYGVMSYRVARRRKELAIRVALGAERRDVMRMIVGDGTKLALAGAVVGCAIAWAAAPAVAGLLYGVRATDGRIMISASGLCLLVAVLSCWLPAWRATRVEPTDALRLE